MHNRRWDTIFLEISRGGPWSRLLARTLFPGMFKKRLPVLILALTALLILAGCGERGGERGARPRAVRGEMDLSDWRFERDGAAKLDGQWEFFWWRALEPGEFPVGKAPGEKSFIDLPGAWNGYEAGGKDETADVFATFRLILKIRPDDQVKALVLAGPASNFTPWIDGMRLTPDRGADGPPASGARPGPLTRYRFPTENNRMEVVLQASRLPRGSGGAVGAIRFGPAEKIPIESNGSWAMALFRMGVLLVIGYYNLTLFLFHGKRPSSLYFGLLCVTLAGTFLFSGSSQWPIYSLFPHWRHETIYRLESLCVLLSAPLFLLFVLSRFPRVRSRAALRSVQGAGLFIGILLLFTPARLLDHAHALNALLWPLCLLWGLLVLRKACRDKRGEAPLYAGCVLLLTLAALHDALLHHDVIHTIPLFPPGLLLFILFHPVAFSLHISRVISSAEKLAEELKRKERLLARANTLKSDFLLNTSRALRSPLNGIIGIAESLMDGAAGGLSSRASENMALVAAGGKRLAGRIDDILLFTRLKYKDLSLNKKPVDLRPMVDAVLFAAAGLGGEKPVSFKNEIPADIPRVDGDEDKLERILFNIVGNAVKFRERGRITVSGVKNEGRVEISVSRVNDEIAKEMSERVFGTFERMEASFARESGWTGLGLFVAGRLVELHDGRILFESGRGKGSRIIVAFPMSEEKREEETDAAPLPARGVSSNRSGAPDAPAPPPGLALPRVDGLPGEAAQVLVVDDDPIFLQSTANQLALDGISAAVAASGEKALEMIQTRGWPSLVLLDVMMPKMSGYAVCKKLREKCDSSELVIIMLTSRHGISERIKGFKAGADDYIVKPFSKNEITARIRSHLRLKEARTMLDENLTLKESLARHKKEKRELRRTRRWMAGVLNSLEEAVISIDGREKICFCNRACERMLGYTEKDLLGRPYSDIVPGRILTAVPRLKKAPRTRSLIKRYEKVGFRRADDKILPANASLVRIDSDNERRIVLMLRRPREAPVARGRRILSKKRSMGIVNELTRNRVRIQRIKEKLLETPPRSRPEILEFIKDLNMVDAILEEMARLLLGKDREEDERQIIPEIMHLTLSYWREATNTTKIDLALRSGLWKVYTNLDGWERAQTMDKYLTLETLPKKPRWKQVLSTVEYVLEICQTESATRNHLELMLVRLRMMGQ
ncbi:MAG: response regulator [Desulfobacterales bacterium]|nr:response regulator [Desulfobacterales bacterium]